MDALSSLAVAWSMNDGRDILDRLIATQPTDPLAGATALRRRGLTVEQVHAVLDIAAGTTSARAVGQPAHSWWSRSAAEQASHPAVAEWRARRFGDLVVTDLTAGCGGDAMAFARVAAGVVAVERDPSRALLLRRNLETNCLVVLGDVLSKPVAPTTWWADPARRRDGRRLRRLVSVIPSVPALLQTFGDASGGVAVSPAVDLVDPHLPGDAELEFVQVGTRLVEATIWLGDMCDRGPAGGGEWRAKRSATLLPEGLHIRGEPLTDVLPITEIGAFLLEPAPASVRARLHEREGERIGASRIARGRAMLTAPGPSDSPWFTSWRVEAVLPMRAKIVRGWLRERRNDLPMEISLHGVETDVEAWIADVGAPRGPNGRHLHLLRLGGHGTAVLTRQVPRPPTGVG